MRSLFLILLLTASLLPSCGRRSPGPILSIPPSATSTIEAVPPTSITPSPSLTSTIEHITPSPYFPPPTLTQRPTATPGFKIQSGESLPSTRPLAADRSMIADRPLIAFEAGIDQNKTLLLADPLESTMVEYKFPAAAHFATPFLAGLSPAAHYFVYFEGGTLENIYGEEHLRLSTRDLVLYGLDLQSGEIIFSTPLLSPTFPKDLEPIAETIKDDWHFTFQNATFEVVVAATQELLLDRIRNVAWSPDGSLLAFASQDPGHSSDLFFFSPESQTVQPTSTDPGHVLKTVWSPDSSALIIETSSLLKNPHKKLCWINL